MVVEVVWVVLGIIFMAPEAVSVVLEVVWVVLGMVTVVLGVVVMVLRVVARVRKVFFRRHEDGEEEGGCAFFRTFILQALLLWSPGALLTASDAHGREGPFRRVRTLSPPSPPEHPAQLRCSTRTPA